MKAAKTQKTKCFIHQKELSERKENNITPAKTNIPISQTSSERLKLTIQTYRMRNKELKGTLMQIWKPPHIFKFK